MNKYKILLASHNNHKAQEFKDMLNNEFEIVTLHDLGIEDEIVEDGETIQENADIKVNFLKNYLGEKSKDYLIMADDTGLFVDALNGEPGVYSARYAGENCTFRDNNEKLLKALKDVPEKDRTAHFSTCISIITPDGKLQNAIGNVDGSIALELVGEEGFGYDPIFIEQSTQKTYAQMSAKEKNEYSHRRKALENSKEILNQWK